VCGIAGVYIKDPSVVKSHKGLELFADLLLLGIEERGKHATGFVAVTADGKARMDKDAIPASEFIKSREALPLGTKMLLLHTRFQTKGDAKNHLNNHPVIWKSCFAVHNGSINNDDELFKEHGLERHAEVDSEIIPAMMHGTGYDVEKMKAVLESFEGSCATSILDPIQMPNKVVLAKGDTSPLYIFEGKKFIVWSSTEKSIKEAWARVLGTPPKTQKIKWTTTGRFFVVSDEGIEEHSFSPKKPPPVHYQRQGYVGFQAWDGERHRAGTWEDGKFIPRDVQIQLPPGGGTVHPLRAPNAPRITPESDNVRVTTHEVRQRVEAERAAKKGLSRLWVNRLEDKDYVPGDKWVMCFCCNVLIHDDDFVETVSGKKCLDCAHWRRGIYMEKVGDAAKPVNQLTKDQMQMLDAWSEDEEFIHREVLEAMEKDYGFSQTFIDAAVSRMDIDPYVTDYPELASLVAFLIFEYNQRYSDWWEHYEDGENIIADGFLKAFKKDKTEEKTEVVEQEPVEGEVIEEPEDLRCDSCDGFILTGTRCRACNRADKRKVKKFLKKASNGKCICCKKKSKMVVKNAEKGEHIEYCNIHFKVCHQRGCQMEPNHLAEDGRRYCHNHVRGKSAMSDTNLKNSGYVMERV